MQRARTKTHTVQIICFNVNPLYSANQFLFVALLCIRLLCVVGGRLTIGRQRNGTSKATVAVSEKRRGRVLLTTEKFNSIDFAVAVEICKADGASRLVILRNLRGERAIALTQQYAEPRLRLHCQVNFPVAVEIPGKKPSSGNGKTLANVKGSIAVTKQDADIVVGNIGDRNIGVVVTAELGDRKASTRGKAGMVSEWKTSGWMKRAVSIAEKYFRPVGSNRSSSDQIRDAVFVEVADRNIAACG